MDTVDTVVIGAGSAGCVLAARLSEDGNRRVMLLEAGGSNQVDSVREPGLWPTLWDSAQSWGYSTTLQAGYADRSIPCPRGKGLGGTSAINAMIYMRGAPRDFDRWRDEGNPGWGWSDVLPYFLKSEDQSRGASALHGTGGPMRVADAASPSTLSLAFVEAAAACGHARNGDFNGESQRGAGLYQFTADAHGRFSTDRAFLAPARQRPNLQVVTHARVLRVLCDGQAAVGVEYFQDGSVRRIGAGEVILSAGAIDSPKLLMLSGIGDPRDLETHGVPVVHALRGVGAGLHDHPGSAVILRLREPQSAPLGTNIVEAGLFMHSGLELDGYETDTQFFFVPASPILLAALRNPWGMQISVQACRPRSRGSVRLRSSDPADAPLIDPAYLTDPYDAQVQLRAIREARRLAGSEPLRGHWNIEAVPGAAAADDTSLLASIRGTSGCIWHPVGTCRMGPRDDDVVDASLRVHGMKGLRVVDASVMPHITSGNTNAPTIMIAEKAASMMLGKS